MNHYGLEPAFKFQVIELCKHCVLLVREQVSLDLLFAIVAPALISNFAIYARASMQVVLNQQRPKLLLEQQIVKP